MSVEHIEVLVEEPSMEAFLNLLLPRILGDTSFAVHAYRCKQELLNLLPQRLNGYKKWLPENSRIIVIVDRDNDDCHQLKARLEQIASNAGFSTRSASRGITWNVVNRLAIEELESWYFGEWEAVQMAFPRVPRTVPSRAKYRDSDSIAGGTWEAFERILQRAGYFKSGLRKIETAKAVAKHMIPERNRSHSFQVLFNTFKEFGSG